MERKICILKIKDKDDDVTYTFNLTDNDVGSLIGMPYNAKRRLNDAGLDVNKSGERLSIMYDNNEKGSVNPIAEYSDIEDALMEALDDLMDGSKDDHPTVSL